MKLTFNQLIKDITSDRHLMVVLACLVTISIIFCIYITVSLRPSELQVVTHYSAFGTTNFYRDKWFYLVGFVVFGLVNAIVYGALACKIFMHKGRALAIPFAWMGVVVMFVAISVLYQVLKVASLT
ncbi:hypothetical protein A2707_05245 [Candidatus Saccharibacteria bacterium RIFCSPHIGHO2_01_FULL_45_15]|nr:MAG: hypothetical protein A2707_05245 [Candidatus Saccharibacteria bacterium RIFCSPHIGHO2_01_FULL_45_15]OGL27416.1 MAG: hypothetical protein A3C39_05245 [Candidatus Saccharibacteria bacterium RIFCSPHIGHO2_02_FULL_46_12]OGL32632.1 MAG: hypothetical protein A3E76_04720 [Candidatus Saccharibacteria bacterium RIFCSPHIGHO2_12_FULL_44_22]